MVRTIYQHLSPAEVHGQLDRVMEQLLEPFAHVAELLAGGVLAKQHDEWAAARPKGKSGGTEFAQPLLRKAIHSGTPGAGLIPIFAALVSGPTITKIGYGSNRNPSYMPRSCMAKATDYAN